MDKEIEGWQGCTECGYTRFFLKDDGFQCGRCEAKSDLKWKQLIVTIGKWTLNGWVHQHQNEAKVRLECEKMLSRWDRANNWQKKTSNVTHPIQPTVEPWKAEKVAEGVAVTPNDYGLSDATIGQTGRD